MVNLRLIWFLESNNLLDQSTKFSSPNRNPNQRSIHPNGTSGCSLFWFWKAYDILWPYRIFKDLKDLRQQGRLPIFIKQFLKNRHFQTRINNSLSDSKPQEIDVPQSCILFVIVLMIKINKITICLPAEFNDDFLICYWSKIMATIYRKMQQCINKILKRTLKNGFKISCSKTTFMHSYYIHKMHNQPTLNGIEIAIIQQFLGINPNAKLYFIPHIKQLRIKCNQTIKVFRIISHTDGGADKTQTKLYTCLIWSKLDYACFIYGATKKSYHRGLETIHPQGPRIVLGAFTTSSM